MPYLQKITFHEDYKLKTEHLQVLHKFPCLESVEFIDCIYIRDLTELRHCTSLRSLSLKCDVWHHLSRDIVQVKLPECKKLTNIAIDLQDVSIAELVKLKNLQSITLYNWQLEQDIEMLSTLKSLKEICFERAKDNPFVPDLFSFQNYIHLKLKHH